MTYFTTEPSDTHDLFGAVVLILKEDNTIDVMFKAEGSTDHDLIGTIPIKEHDRKMMRMWAA